MSDPHDALPDQLRASWHRFLDAHEELRTPLYRYCRRLARDPWDAEDLVQDTLARAFVGLARMGSAPEHPRAWLFRIASNLWIDRTRRAREVSLAHAMEPATTAADPREAREAAGTLLARLAPQERAAVVLKDVFDMKLEEIAEVLGTTLGAVKAAVHRGRSRLAEPDPPPSRTPKPQVLDAFCAAFAARDLDRLTALLLDTAAVEVVGVTTQYGPEAAARTVLWGMLFGHERLAHADTQGGIEPRFVQGALPTPPRVEALEHRGRWILVHWYAHRDGEAVRAITELDVEGDRIAALRNYFFTADFIADVCAELGLPCRTNGHRWWLAGCPR